MPLLPRRITLEDVFRRDGYRCVYCCRDLLHDFDVFWLVQLDRLMPDGSHYDKDNVVTSCYVCNNLKGTFKPKGASHKERVA